MFDDQRPTLTLTSPTSGQNERLDRIVIGMHDYNTGLEPESFSVTADFPIDGIAGGQNLAAKLKPVAEGVWAWQLDKPLTALKRGTLVVQVKDRQGNISRVVRQLSVSVP
jgi:hypothetical protein